MKTTHKNHKAKAPDKGSHEPKSSMPQTTPENTPDLPDLSLNPEETFLAQGADVQPREPIERSASAPIGAGQDASSLGSGQIPFGFGQAPTPATSAPRQF